MTPQQLYDSIIHDISALTNTEEVHPFVAAALMDCCENTIQENPQVQDEQTLIVSALTGFHVAFGKLKEMIRRTLDSGQADTVTLDYRGQKFTFDRNSPLLQ